MNEYNPANWYWIVGGSATQVYSSAAGNYVPVADATYVAWLATGCAPSRILNEAELGEVLARHGLAPADAGVLDGYKTARASGVVAQAAFRVLFNHENRLRAVERALLLNGSPPDITLQQAAVAVKSLM